MRFRAEELTFQVSGAESADQIAVEGAAGKGKLGVVTWPGMSKTLTNDAGSAFTLHVAPGSFRGGEIVGLYASTTAHGARTTLGTCGARHRRRATVARHLGPIH